MFSKYVSPIDDSFIDFCDRDSNWGPLLFLRPDRTERLTNLRTAAGAILLGLPLGLIAGIVMSLFALVVAKPPPQVVYFPLVLTGAYWIIANVTLARAWNHRASRMSRRSLKGVVTS
jgi:hypothetical protein